MRQVFFSFFGLLPNHSENPTALIKKNRVLNQLPLLVRAQNRDISKCHPFVVKRGSCPGNILLPPVGRSVGCQPAVAAAVISTRSPLLFFFSGLSNAMAAIRRKAAATTPPLKVLQENDCNDEKYANHRLPSTSTVAWSWSRLVLYWILAIVLGTWLHYRLPAPRAHRGPDPLTNDDGFSEHNAMETIAYLSDTLGYRRSLQSCSFQGTSS